MTTTLLLLHVLAAILASWRLTELITLDAIAAPLRRRFPDAYLLTCRRCVSVWAGGFATLLLWLAPWANWPLALAWTYLWHLDTIAPRGASGTQPKGERPMPTQTNEQLMQGVINRLQGLIGQQTVQLTALATQLEGVQAELADAKAQIAKTEAAASGVDHAASNGHVGSATPLTVVRNDE